MEGEKGIDRISEIVVSAKYYVAATVEPPPLGNWIRDRRNITCDATSIEHIVAASEAHDSGLCAADAATKARFSRDLRNLTLASPRVNRFEKSGKNAAEWLPARNRCWFAGRVVEVRRAYGLTVDRREAAALERILAGCESTDLEPVVCAAPSGAAAGAASAPAGVDDALTRSTTTMGTAQSPARRRGGTGLRRCRGRIRRIAVRLGLPWKWSGHRFRHASHCLPQCTSS